MASGRGFGEQCGEQSWSARQGHILSGGGRTTELYTAERGFPFEPAELPHTLLLEGRTHQQFEEWIATGSRSALVAGAWCRPLFVGGWDHSDQSICGEQVFNLQTPSIFIDLRIPRSPRHAALAKRRSLAEMNIAELTLMAERHAFAGYTMVSGEPPVAVRHHAIDWNFVGKPRPRPNKWRIEMNPSGDIWKEWGWARDEHNQHIYMEQWSRLPGGSGSTGQCVALRRRPAAGVLDAFIVVCGDHFNWIQARRTPQPRDSAMVDVASLSNAVATMAAAGDRAGLEAYLSLEAGHGLVSTGWIFDAALHPWREGTALFEPGQVVVAPDNGGIIWNGERWDALEPLEHKATALQRLFSTAQTARL